MADSLLRSAICAAPSFTGALPKAFDTWTRSRRPGMLVRAIMRIVWLVKPRGALAGGFAFGGSAGRTRACAVVQVATQWSWAASSAGAQRRRSRRRIFIGEAIISPPGGRLERLRGVN